MARKDLRYFNDYEGFSPEKSKEEKYLELNELEFHKENQSGIL